MKTKKILFMVSLLILGGISKGNAQNNIVTTAATIPATLGNQNVIYGVQSGTNTQPNPIPVFPGTGTNNSFFGFQSGFANTFGQSNTFSGSQSGLGNLEGVENVSIGARSGLTLQNGVRNTFIGTDSGSAFNNQQSWQSNTFIGARSGLGFIGGDFNTFIGAETARGQLNPTSGDNNTFIGFQAGTNSAGSGNTYIGGQSGNLLRTANDNVCIGANSGRGDFGATLSNARQNVFIGTASAIHINGGRNNVFMGFQSGVNTQGNNIGAGLGSGNVFLGAQSGFLNIDGRQNVYVGNLSGENTTGSGNVFLGSQSGAGYTAVDNHLAIDNSATTTPLIEGDFGVANGRETITFNVDDTANSTVIINANGTHPANTLGLSALQFADLNNANTAITNTTDKVLSVDTSGNVILVNDKQGVLSVGITNDCSVNNFVPKSTSSGDLVCSQIYDNWNGGPEIIRTGVAIGWASPTPNQNFLYNTTTGPYPASQIELPLPAGRLKLLVNGNEKVNGIYFTSDANYKTEIGALDKPLEKILKLKGVHYYWDVNNNPDMNFDSQVHTGFIAQEVENVLPHLVITQEYETEQGKQDRKSVNYIELIPYLVEAIKTQNDKINALQTQVNCLNERIGCYVSEKNSTLIKFGNTKIISVAPNPSSDIVTVSLNIEKEVESASLEIYDINGKLLSSLNIKERENNISKTFQKDNFGTGVYIISLVINNDSIDSKKIIFE
ncbi:tail fiber domain-containing protein [Flavobacterium sp. 25HG05S-40]|uniref:tail fiber domain-containing protein n=1 Tax=Flavobacterium sp. 25HG05S-40 TaxID=3458682 RepID=UPI004044FD39